MHLITTDRDRNFKYIHSANTMQIRFYYFCIILQKSLWVQKKRVFIFLFRIDPRKKVSGKTGKFETFPLKSCHAIEEKYIVHK